MYWFDGEYRSCFISFCTATTLGLVFEMTVDAYWIEYWLTSGDAIQWAAFCLIERFTLSLWRVNKMNANRQHPQRAQQASATHMRVLLPKGNLKVAQFQISLSSSAICCEYFSYQKWKFFNFCIGAVYNKRLNHIHIFGFDKSKQQQDERFQNFLTHCANKIVKLSGSILFPTLLYPKCKQKRFVIIVRRSARQLLRLIQVNLGFIAMRCRVFRRPGSFVECQKLKRAKRSLIAKSHVAKSKSILSALKNIFFWLCVVEWAEVHR